MDLPLKLQLESKSLTWCGGGPIPPHAGSSGSYNVGDHMLDVDLEYLYFSFAPVCDCIEFLIKDSRWMFYLIVGGYHFHKDLIRISALYCCWKRKDVLSPRVV